MIQNVEPCITLADIPELLINSIIESVDVAVLFDKSLIYLLVNDAACKQLDKTPSDLLGKCILDIYPGIIASNNHRDLLKALDGETIKNSLLESKSGSLFYCYYEPIYKNSQLIGILSKASQTIFP